MADGSYRRRATNGVATNKSTRDHGERRGGTRNTPYRSMIGRSLAGYLAAVCIVSLSTCLAQVEGRKCVCTSKACKEAGVDTCRTKFSCYTEFILTTGRETGESTTTRGCTEGATPLLCETKSWVARSRSADTAEPSARPWIPVPWPRLECCDSHDYCNRADEKRPMDATGERTGVRERTEAAGTAVEPVTPDGGASVGRDATPTSIRRPDRKYEDPESIDHQQPLTRRVKALHVAALVLAVAALVSVLGSCYVVTRFLRSNRYVMGGVN